MVVSLGIIFYDAAQTESFLRQNLKNFNVNFSTQLELMNNNWAFIEYIKVTYSTL